MTPIKRYLGSWAKPNEISYMDFVDRLSEPDNEGLVQVIKRFLLSVLGPRGDGSAPSIFQDKGDGLHISWYS